MPAGAGAGPAYTVAPWLVPLLAAIALTFLVITAAAHLVFREQTADLMGFDQLFNVDAEANVPTWFASLVLHFTAFVAWSIGDSDEPRERNWWRGIAVLLFLMGMDEIASLHNAPTNRLRDVVGVHGGLLMNAWILPAIAVVAAVGVCYLRFLLRLPRWLAWGLVAAGILYVTGGIGLEVVSSVFEYRSGGLDYDGVTHYSLAFELTAVAEELFEYAGSLLALALLLRHAADLDARIAFRFRRRSPRRAATAARLTRPVL